MSSFDNTGDLPEILRDKRTAVIGIDLFDDLDKHFVPLDCDLIEIFHDDGAYDIPEIREVGNDRQLAENAVDLIDRGCASDYAIVLKASSPIADAVRAALYRRGIPFVNSLSVRDLAQIRDYIGFLGYCMEYETVRVGQVKELFADGGEQPGADRRIVHKIPHIRLPDHATELQRFGRVDRDLRRAENRFVGRNQPLRHREAAGHDAAVAAGPDHAAIDPAAEQQLDRPHQNRLARARFAGHDIETGSEFKFGFFDQSEIRDFHVGQHRSHTCGNISYASSLRNGIDSAAPGRLTVIAEARVASSIASFSAIPSSSPAKR